MPRTGDLVADEFAVDERASVVRADVVNRIEAALNVEERDHLALHFDQELARIGDFRHVGHADELRHRVCSFS